MTPSPTGTIPNQQRDQYQVSSLCVVLATTGDRSGDQEEEELNEITYELTKAEETAASNDNL